MMLKEESEKAGLKFNIQKTKTSWQRGKSRSSNKFSFLGLQSDCGW